METIKQYLLPVFRFKKEHLAILISLLLFIYYPVISRYLDVTSAPIDPGALSAIIIAVVALLIFKALTWWLIKALWPAMAIYSEYSFENNFNSLSPCWKVSIYLSFYLLVLFSFVLTLSALV
ncbi:hypothetical protein [Desertivirga xinjiangensis]|uniref:hypothetical protein n=1 Tax=Desertivirga xinjiangensis TaxID=539206 RepID=UPI00210E9DF5|nr:hypothetical protein [Pedobacter xinjiangensis]